MQNLIMLSMMQVRRRGGRIVADVVEGLGLRMALHVRLSGQDEDLERLGVKLGREDETKGEEDRTREAPG